MTGILFLSFVLAFGEAVYVQHQDLPFGRDQQDEPYKSGGAGVINPALRWPNKTIVFKFDDYFPSASRDTFFNAINHIRGRTCIRLKERHNEDSYLNILQEGDRCESQVGKVETVQNLYLCNGCNLMSTHVRELVHAIGFHNEHQRSDRDDYVTFNDEAMFDNITCQRNLQVYHTDVVSSFGVSYDYNSIMHGRRNYCSQDAVRDTITPMNPDVTIGVAERLSHSDIMKVNNMYCTGTQGIRIQHSASQVFLKVGNVGDILRNVTVANWTGEENQNFTADWYAMNNSAEGSTLVPWSQDRRDREMWMLSLKIDPSGNFVDTAGHEDFGDNERWWVEREENDNVAETLWYIHNKGTNEVMIPTGDLRVKTVPKNPSDSNQLWRIWSA